ncbi:hypothetical protein DFJ73DRAFT_884896 [Zopfochytrium polystomum]|nr:hypothetical protein DFJ73DRAFT_884896 [Zopfochytrium polystomum]
MTDPPALPQQQPQPLPQPPRPSSYTSPMSPLFPFDVINVKIMLLGDSGVGKSQLFGRLTKKTFSDFPKPTEGIDFATHTIKISNGRVIKAQIMDTSGAGKSRSIIQNYWALATGALVVYDVTNKDSFSSVRKWVRDFKDRHRSIDPTIMVVGNKCEPDNDDYREVSIGEAQAYALAQGFFFMEVSALESINVDLAFGVLLTEVYHSLLERKAKAQLENKQPLQAHHDEKDKPSSLKRRSSQYSINGLLLRSPTDARPETPTAPAAEDTMENRFRNILGWVTGSTEESTSPTSTTPLNNDSSFKAHTPLTPVSPLAAHSESATATPRSGSYWTTIRDSLSSVIATGSAPSTDSASSVSGAPLDGARRAELALAEALSRAKSIPMVDNDELFDDLTVDRESPVRMTQSSPPPHGLPKIQRRTSSKRRTAQSENQPFIPPRRESISAPASPLRLVTGNADATHIHSSYRAAHPAATPIRNPSKLGQEASSTMDDRLAQPDSPSSLTPTLQSADTEIILTGPPSPDPSNGVDDDNVEVDEYNSSPSPERDPPMLADSRKGSRTTVGSPAQQSNSSLPRVAPSTSYTHHTHSNSLSSSVSISSSTPSSPTSVTSNRSSPFLPNGTRLEMDLVTLGGQQRSLRAAVAATGVGEESAYVGPGGTDGNASGTKVEPVRRRTVGSVGLASARDMASRRGRGRGASPRGRGSPLSRD